MNQTSEPWAHLRGWLWEFAAGPLAILLAYIAGVALALYAHPLVLALLAALMAVSSGALAFRLASPRQAVLLLFAALCLGIFLGSVRLELQDSSRLDDYPGKYVMAELTVSKPASVKGERISFVGKATKIRLPREEFETGEDVMVQLDCPGGCQPPDSGILDEGAMVTVSGIVQLPTSTPGADFDYGQYLRRQGINAVISGSYERMELMPQRRGGIPGFVDAARRHARESLGIGGWGGASGLLLGMVLGDTAQVPEEVISDFRGSGLLHMLAVSGQNVVLLGFVIMLICRALLVPRLAATLIAILIICIYVPLTGAGPSIVRAGIVGVLGLMAYLFSRQTNAFHFLALAAAIIMTINPWSLLDPGFQLSFGAVLAIFLVAPVLRAPLLLLPAVLSEGIAITTAASLVTAPIMMYHFQQVSLVTVPANIAGELVAGPVMFLGTLSILLAPVSSLLAWTLNAIAAVCTGYLIVVARFFASLPGAVYIGSRPGVVAIVLFYGMLGGMVATARTIGFSGAARRLGLHRARLVVLALVLAALLGFACFSGSATGPPPAAYTVSILDVGQGDSTLIQVPGGATILIDGGPGSEVIDRLRESGVTRLDAVILTHPHADHLGGLDKVLNDYPVSAFYDSGFANASPAYRDLLKLVESKGISYGPLRRGQELIYGDLTLECINPGDAEKPDDLNANSVVTVASYHGLDILCTGDAEEETLASLELPQVEVFKIGHHGSKDASLARTLDKLQPDITVISVGEGNPYGHPAEDTLSKLRASGTRVLRTDLVGTVRVSLTDSGVQINTDR